MVDVVLHYCFRCVKCGGWIRIQVTTLHRLLGLPIIPASDTASVALSCRHCRRVSVYGLRGTAAPHPITGDYVFWRDMKCGEEGCNPPLRVIAVRTAEMSDEGQEADVATWEWDELRRPREHVIPKIGS
jgi:hypothetical protein